MHRPRTNHFDSMPDFNNSDSNQFLPSTTPMRLDSKDELIIKLEMKNLKIQNEIKKVEEVLRSPAEKTKYGNKVPESQYDSLKQQLENAYKQIKIYDMEVKKAKSTQNPGGYAEQIKRIEGTLNEKRQLTAKLKRHQASIKKESMQITKLLKDDALKDYYAKKADSLSADIKFLRQKARELEDKEKASKRNFEKNSLFTKKLETSFQQDGVNYEELQTIKERVLLNSARSKGHRQQQSIFISQPTSKRQGQYVQDRTPQAYKQLMNEIKLLEKMDGDYKGHLKLAENQLEQACIINEKSRNRLLEIEDQIQRVEQRANQLKKQIDPRNLKPQRAFSMDMKMDMKIGGVGRYGKVNKSLAEIKSPFKPLFKTQQVGTISKSGKRFTDRIKLGKYPAKIVGLTVFQSQGDSNIVGIQASYNVKGSIKKSAVNMIHDPKKAQQKSIEFKEGDYLKQIQCVVNEDSVIVGIRFTSFKGIPFQAGCMEGARRPLNISSSEHPACLFGSFTPAGFEVFGCELVEEQE